MPSNNVIFQQVRETSFMKPTNDDWAPTFEGGFCEVRGFVGRRVKALEAATNTTIPFWVKFIVSGNDDTMIELERFGSLQACLEFYEQWFNILSNMSLVSKKDLHDFGFDYL